VFNGAVWSVGKDWSTSNTFNWTPAVGGNYTIGVWARSSGNSADAAENNALRTMNFTITGPAGLAVTDLAADKASPQPLGTVVVFTATATGGVAPLQFKWWVFNGAVWSVGKDWSTSNTFNWTPAVGGNYTIGVWARSSGNGADAAENNALRTMNFTITGAAGSQVRAFNDLLICNPDCIRLMAD
jgi:subtilase family serine protease